jgi:hypothetical protein
LIVLATLDERSILAEMPLMNALLGTPIPKLDASSAGLVASPAMLVVA